VNSGGYTEVGELDLPIFTDEHVRGLHVAVDDAALVSVRERCRDFAPDFERAVERQALIRTRPHELRKRHAVDELRNEIVGALELEHIVETNDAWVRQTRSVPGLATQIMCVRNVG
jgi:hypothetical protein